jgi:SAM-dependent methyltransferase
VLADLVAERLPDRGRILDVGAGDGTVAVLIRERKPALEVEGVDVLVRAATPIPVREFDGLTIPFTDASFDGALLIDVLHHAEDPERLLREAARVASVVVVKDHLADGVLAHPTLRFMDRIGNARHGVDLRYEYWGRQQWIDVARRAGLRESALTLDVPLYPPPLSWVFGRGLHFVARFQRI